MVIRRVDLQGIKLFGRFLPLGQESKIIKSKQAELEFTIHSGESDKLFK
jgi:hypothetical protein